MLSTGKNQMAIHKIKDFNTEYKEHLDDRDLKGLDVYVADEKIGSVEDMLVDDNGQFRYLVINTGIWVLGKKVLLPIGRAKIDENAHRVYAQNLTKEQVEALPQFTNDLILDYDHEEQVRSVYRTETPKPAAVGMDATATTLQDRSTYTYDKEPDLYALTDRDHSTLKLYEERLVASKTRQKAGETIISKHIETEKATASVPIEKERVVIERIPGKTQTAVAVGEATFQEGEVSRVEVYAEVPEFHKEAFVREEVRVSKVVDKETATAQEQLRREELDVNVEGNPVVDRQI
jgi:uncharacterized protein (TIGR02271 family)